LRGGSAFDRRFSDHHHPALIPQCACSPKASPDWRSPHRGRASRDPSLRQALIAIPVGCRPEVAFGLSIALARVMAALDAAIHENTVASI
jgi:hypothetical protein